MEEQESDPVSQGYVCEGDVELQAAELGEGEENEDVGGRGVVQPQLRPRWTQQAKEIEIEIYA